MLNLDPPESGFEEGLQNGKAVASKWQPAPTSQLGKWIEVVENYPVSHCGERDPDLVLKELRACTQEDLLDHAKLLHRQKMDALPDLKVFPELRGIDQFLDERARGYAEGAGIDVREVYLESYWKEIMFYLMAGKRLANDPGHCTEHWFPVTPNGPLLGKGWDDVMTWYTDNPFPIPPDPPPEPTMLEIPPREEGEGYRVHGTSNEMGLCVDNGGGAMYEYEPEIDKAVFPVNVNQMVLSRCATTLEAVEMFKRYNFHWGPCNMVVGDAEGNGALFEKSKYAYAVRMTSRNVLITTYGGCEDEDMMAFCDTSTPVFKYCARRLKVMKEVVDEAEKAGGLSLDVYWDSVLHHDPEAPGCTHLETRPDDIELFTFGAFAVLPREGRALKRIVSRENGGLRYGCQNRAVESRVAYL